MTQLGIRVLLGVTLLLCMSWIGSAAGADTPRCVIVDTGQDACYGTALRTAPPREGTQFFGQDAQYVGNAPSYRDNGDGTVTDLTTRLMWSKAVDKRKVSLVEADRIARKMSLAGHTDWRVPNIKELYSLIDFRGYTGFSHGDLRSGVPSNAVPFINTDYFDFRFGDTRSGERYIAAQWLSSTKYVSTTMDGAKTLFGVNFADGRIKGYGYERPGRRRPKKFYVRYVRGEAYGDNQFADNKDGTITDRATGLTWMQKDSGKAMTWQQALAHAESLVHGGHNDWRLPNAKELQYLVDYSRSPGTTHSAAIDPVFETTSIVNEAGQKDYPFFWTSTTHLDGPRPGGSAAYVTFGRALGKMRGRIMDVHGAGAQRSDPKTGQPGQWHGPQGDLRRVLNFVRCVRGETTTLRSGEIKADLSKYPYNVAGKWSASAKGDGTNDKQGTSEGRPHDGKGKGKPEGRTFVRRLDKNGDGKVSKTEFDGPAHHFTRFDRNKDGFISEDEAPTGPPPRREHRRR